MSTRKNFLLQGSLASTALLIAKPFRSFANAMAPLTGYSLNDNKIVLVHTSNDNKVEHQAVSQATGIKKKVGNVLLVHAGAETDTTIARLPYDASLHLNNSVLNSTGNYKIVYRNEIKIGIITATEGDDLAACNTLSAYLKKEKACNLVVCLSQLGYNNDGKADDRKLAELSTHIDIIISGHARNASPFPVVLHNSKKEEVVIHSAADNGFALGNIEITFDNNRNKRSIAFNNLLSRV